MNESVLRIKNEIISELRDILESPRWNSQDSPFPYTITELWERVDNRDGYKYFREHAGGRFLLNVLETTEKAFNDDWLPYEIPGLQLNTYREFLSRLLEELHHTDIEDSEDLIKKFQNQFR